MASLERDMTVSQRKKTKKSRLIARCPTGVAGLDEITLGGLPRHRATLVCGGSGCGKSLLGLEFVIQGAALYNEPGLFLAFEETEAELMENIASIGYDVSGLIKRKLLVIEHVAVDVNEYKNASGYNLDGLFIQLESLIKEYKIKRVTLDTLEVLISSLGNEAILRVELQRLFRWFKSKKITVIITAESGTGALSRCNLEEYVADCVILLDNRMAQQIATRRIRLAKYRGSAHGANEYPFIITDKGIVITPITSIKLDYNSTTQRISSGIKKLDLMLDGKGYYRGSSILISGTAGTGKSTMAASFANGVCLNGEKCLYFAFEEAATQIVRNMRSVGIDLKPWLDKDLLRFHAVSPNSSGLEYHLNEIHKLVHEFKPSVVIIDPISSLKSVGDFNEVKDMLSLTIAYFKNLNITLLFTTLTAGYETIDYIKSNEGVSSLMDVWVYIQYKYADVERYRQIAVLKARGIAHSNQLCVMNMSKKGIIITEEEEGQFKSSRMKKAVAGSGASFDARIQLLNSDNKPPFFGEQALIAKKRRDDE
jgi:circadian clock protein KaiC